MSEGRALTPREHLLLDVRISVCYDHRRRAFLESFDRIAKAITILGGSVAIVGLSENSEITILIASMVVVFFSTLNLVCASGQAAARYYELEKRFIELEKKIIAVSEENFTLVDTTKFSNELLTISAEEPTVLRGLYALCYNQVFRTEGFGKKYYLPLKWYHYVFAHIADINTNSIIPPTQGESDFPARIS